MYVYVWVWALQIFWHQQKLPRHKQYIHTRRFLCHSFVVFIWLQMWKCANDITNCRQKANRQRSSSAEKRRIWTVSPREKLFHTRFNDISNDDNNSSTSILVTMWNAFLRWALQIFFHLFAIPHSRIYTCTRSTQWMPLQQIRFGAQLRMKAENEQTKNA